MWENAANNLPRLAERSHMIYVNNEFSLERLVKSEISLTFVDRENMIRCRENVRL